MARPRKPWYWKARKQWYVEINGKQQRLGPDKEEAHRKFHELMAKKPTLSNDSVAVILDKFLVWTQAHRSARTFRWYKDFCQDFVTKHPNLTLDDLDADLVEQWASQGGGKRGKITAMKRAFNWAVKNLRTVHSNPIAAMERPESGRCDTVISETELDELLEYVKDEPFRDLLIVSWDCGCRPQETKILEASHVELFKHRWRFPKEQEKKKKRPRIVYMTERAEEIVSRRMREFPQGPLFRNTHGTPWTASAVKCRFARLEKKVGKRYQQYAMRHSWITRMIEAGVDSHVVAVLAGHSNTAMIDTVYSHIEHQHDFLLKAIRPPKSGGGD